MSFMIPAQQGHLSIMQPVVPLIPPCGHASAHERGLWLHGSWQEPPLPYEWQRPAQSSARGAGSRWNSEMLGGALWPLSPPLSSDCSTRQLLRPAPSSGSSWQRSPIKICSVRRLCKLSSSCGRIPCLPGRPQLTTTSFSAAALRVGCCCWHLDMAGLCPGHCMIASELSRRAVSLSMAWCVGWRSSSKTSLGDLPEAIVKMIPCRSEVDFSWTFST